MEIICDQPEHLVDFVRLNELWIKEHFSLEAVDRVLANDPGAIRRGGGHTICAIEAERVVGVVALKRLGNRELELARMAVDPDFRGRGIGRALARTAIQKAVDLRASKIILLSNTVLGPAIALYRSLGFSVVRAGTHPEYSRCNVVMEKVLGECDSARPRAAPVQVPVLMGKRFRLIENSATGVAGDETVLSFTADDDVVVGRYEGGGILVGHVLARRIGRSELEMLYHGATGEGQIRSGMATASFAVDGEGAMSMTLQWRWTSGDSASGTSVWKLDSTGG